jgi:hypothetical protein
MFQNIEVDYFYVTSYPHFAKVPCKISKAISLILNCGQEEIRVPKE